MEERLAEGAVAKRADVGAGREDLVGAGDHDRADLVVVVEPLERRAQLVHHLRREGVARLGPVELHQRDVAVALLGDQSGHVLVESGRKAEMPVASRPMISFWICDVPS